MGDVSSKGGQHRSWYPSASHYARGPRPTTWTCPHHAPAPGPAQVICVDNFFTGSKDNIAHLLDKPNFELMR